MSSGISGGLSEKVITRQIMAWVSWNGFFVWKQWQGPMSRPGVSDILGVLPGGRFLAIEVKTRRGRLTRRQEAFLSAVNRQGGLGFVARSLEDVVGTLESYTRKAAYIDE
ncbi:hypothetical protein DBT_1829 [Dissulfuribacter thermophilus]|uniref:VRR-NUC domain-containing protein n=1 Tax=Dissulfuribacter thermophilus TaxID=1156395 RepID=A0A1B9F494_9BACT|nr:VRR-NUC domain-containing protein [Dissulfuribacter thermophilus]OCC14769.1 hypothetical protein DBT_1829 [Dissulfuribacter thermophilus]